ncbi:hypothetical protein GQ53DRAFT_820407 [Thozetella sp. PMI_491]|nr:hypothetical protein GQ53DRAFT_820407 [Thozetella sp. PMI_491]
MGNAPSYQLVDTYNATNYLSRFAYYYGADPGNGGFVNYLNRDDAVNQGLISTINTASGPEVKIGVDSRNVITNGVGRNSVRIQSANSYTNGLFVGYFSHLPKPVCGSWPAFWMYSYDNSGEFDIYENWNTLNYNRVTFHTSSAYPTCALSSTPVDSNNPVLATSCYSPQNIGCGVAEHDGYWGSSSGGTYALEWTSDHVTVWAWARGSEPSDLLAKTPNPSGWSNPHMKLDTSTCSSLSSAFKNMYIILNIDLCGNPAGQSEWTNNGCAASTGTTCNSYVANNPSAFSDVYFQMSRLEVYQTTS